MKVSFALLLLLPLQDSEFCSKFNKCHTEHDKEKIKCPKCEKNQIPKNDALCSSCASKEKVCMHCGKPKEGTAPAAKKGKCKNIDEAVAAIKADDLRKLLMHIASDEMKGRLAGSPEHTKLTDEYAEIYKKAGLKPAWQGAYIQPVDIRGRQSRNVCAMLEGQKSDEVIIYGAHSDHIGVVGGGPPGQQKGGANGNDQIFNGADDNGSGSTCLITVARVLGESGLKPKRTILFINWTGEEWGLVGSKHNAQNPCVPKEHILAVINTDMLSRYSLKNKVFIGGLGTEAGNDWETICQKCCDKAGIQCELSQPSRIAGGDSDHSSYRDIGIPGMFWWTGMHSDYHTVNDNPDKCDYGGMEKVARAVALVLWELANSDKKWQFQNQ
jgi:hypothetical protein